MRAAGVHLLGVLFSLLLAATVEGAVHTELEPRLVDEMETVQLVLRIDGQAQAAAPDLTPLHEDFEVLGSQTSSRISSINGRTTAMVEYQINLRPKRTGELRIPPLEVGGEKSQELTLVVRPLDPGLRQTIENMVFFESDISANPVYVQAQTVLTRRLFYSNGVQIYSDLPGAPEIADAVVIPLGDTRSYSTLRGGLRYGVIEQRFAVFPERSGPLEIAPISVTSSVRLSSGGRVRRSGIRVSTQAITLEVLPIPESYPKDAAWLPATDVQLSQSWEPERAAIDVGAQIDLTIRLAVDGNTSSAIPPLALSLPDSHFKVYPEAPQLEESTASGSVSGSRQQRYALIPTAPGMIDLAPVSIVWWDTATDRVRTTSLAPHSINLTGQILQPEQPDTAADSEPQPADTSAPRTLDADPRRSDGDSRDLLESLPWSMLGIGLSAVLALTMILFLVRRPLSRLRHARLWHGSQRTTARARLREFEQALQVEDPAAVRQTLGRFLEVLYLLPQPQALQRFRALPGAAEQFDALEAVLYGATQAHCDYVRLKQLVREADRLEQKRRDEASRRNRLDALPPLSA